MSKKNYKNVFIGRLLLSDGVDRRGIKHVQLLRTGTYKHPQAPNGAFQITKEMLLKMQSNFENNVRRLDKGEIAVDYGHEDGGPAAGWIEKIEVVDDDKGGGTSLWVDINYTAKAEESIASREWRFISADIDFEYEDNESGMKLGPTLLGAGLVNRPHIKAMQAIFGEQDYNNEETNQQEYSMTPEEMLKKIGELEAAIADLKAKLSGAQDAVKAADASAAAKDKELGEVKEQLKEANLKVTKLSEEKETVAKEAKFNEFVAAGKVTPAQKDTFMKMDLKLAEELFKDAKVVNLNDNGHGGAGKGGAGGSDEKDKKPADIIEARAAKLMESNKSLTLGEAYSQVMSADKDLAKKYEESMNA